MTQASNQALADLKESGKLSKQERMIVWSLTFQPMTIKMLRESTGLKESTICARIAGSQSKGYVKEAGKRGKYTLWSYVSDPNERKQVAHEYRRKRFIATAERMLNEYGEFIDREIAAELKYKIISAEMEQEQSKPK